MLLDLKQCFTSRQRIRRPQDTSNGKTSPCRVQTRKLYRQYRTILVSFCLYRQECNLVFRTLKSTPIPHSSRGHQCLKTRLSMQELRVLFLLLNEKVVPSEERIKETVQESSHCFVIQDDRKFPKICINSWKLQTRGESTVTSW